MVIPNQMEVFHHFTTIEPNTSLAHGHPFPQGPGTARYRKMSFWDHKDLGLNPGFALFLPIHFFPGHGHWGLGPQVVLFPWSHGREPAALPAPAFTFSPKILWQIPFLASFSLT